MNSSFFFNRRQERPLEPRAQQIFDEHFRQLHMHIDRMFVVLMCVQWVFAVGVALWIAPFTWDGAQRQIHPHVWLSVVLGGVLTVPAVVAGIWSPGKVGTRHIIAICQVGYSALLIHLMGGRLETHFHVFGSLAFIAAYRDWTVLLPATALVAVDHLVRGLFWPESVFGVVTASNWRWLEHAGWVLFEDLWLVICCHQGICEVKAIARNRAQLEHSQSVLEHQANALEESLHDRDAIVEGALDGFIEIDVTGKIVSWNTQATKVFGWEKSQVLDKSFTETLWPESANDAGPQVTAPAIGDLVNQRVELNAVHRDSTVFPIELAVTSTGTASRIRYCVFAQDISERRQFEERLKKAKDAAEAASESKSMFLANMSHEIRTPLNAILGFTELLRNESKLTPAERESHLHAVHRGGSHLLGIINDVLDLSKIEAGQMTYERLRFSPHQVIVDTLSFMRVRAAEKGISLEASWLGRVPETIESDPSKFRQLLLNLVGNAIKFTEKGGVQLVARLDSANSLLQIEIIDTGVGIASEKIKSLFVPFSQADASVTRKFGGTGLGLSICKHISDALGGEIKINSVEGQGTTFVLTISTGSLAETRLLEAPPQEVLQAKSSSNDAMPKLDGMSILIVDDGEINRQLLEVLLRRAGAKIETATNGVEALEQAEAARYDVILMDMQMPVLDGYSATRRLRERGDQTLVIALTAHAMAGEREKCLAAGCDAYVTKPVDRRELLLTISRMKSPNLVGEPRVINLPKTEPEVEPAGGSEPIRSELDLSDEEIRHIVRKFVDRFDGEVTQLQEEWKGRDWVAMRTRAHRLIGTAGITGYSSISKLAEEMQEACDQKDVIIAARAVSEFCTSAKRLEPIAELAELVESTV